MLAQHYCSTVEHYVGRRYLSHIVNHRVGFLFANVVPRFHDIQLAQSLLAYMREEVKGGDKYTNEYIL